MKARFAIGSALLAAASFSYGYLAHRNGWFPAELISRANKAVQLARDEPASDPTPRGFWQPIAVSDTGGESPRVAEDIGTLPYLAAYQLPPPKFGVVRYDSAAAYRGFNYYTSGHATDVILMGMDGTRLHTWHFEPKHSPSRDTARPGQRPYLHRALILENGDVLTIYNPLDGEHVQENMLVKLDRDSNVIWSYRGGAHHDFEVADDGRIYVLGRAYRSLSPEPPEYPGGFWKWPWRNIPDDRILEDFVIILSPEGEELRRVSILEAFLTSPFSVFAEQTDHFDVLHTNTVEILAGGSHPFSQAFPSGSLLISASHANAIGVLEMDSERIVWALAGPWHRQHEPTVLENGNLLLFDNNGHHGFSKVIEFNPLTLEISWSYEGDAENGFASPVLGSAMRLPNGNTLITESTGGRAFEVTKDNDIVWEFVNPERAGENGELIAVIPQMVRLGRDFDMTWLARDGTAFP